MSKDDDVKTTSKPFPWRCGACREKAVVPAFVDYPVGAVHDGKKYAFTVPGLQVFKCGKCGEIILDSEANQKITQGLRAAVGLLAPEQIRNQLDALGLSQKDFAARLGFAAETVSRWLTGAMIQSKAMDNFMRVYFGSPESRRLLESDHGGPRLDTSKGGKANSRAFGRIKGSQEAFSADRRPMIRRREFPEVVRQRGKGFSLIIGTR